MAQVLLTKTRFADGVWEGVLTGDNLEDLSVGVKYLGADVEGATIGDVSNGTRRLLVPVPIDAIGDGVQTIVIVDLKTDEHLGSFSLICGDAVADDIRATVDLLRQELDLMKAAFRRQFADKG